MGLCLGVIELSCVKFYFFCENSRMFSKMVTLIYAANQQSIEFPILPYSLNHLLSLLSIMTTHCDGERWNRTVILIFNSIASNTFIWFLGNGEPSWFSTKIHDKILLLKTLYTLTEENCKTFLISIWKLSQMTNFQFAGRSQTNYCG